MKKRMLALLLTLCMVVSLLPAQTVLAAQTYEIVGLPETVELGQQVWNPEILLDGQPSEDVRFRITDKTKAVINYIGRPEGGVDTVITFLREGEVTVTAIDRVGTVLASQTVTVTDGAECITMEQDAAQTLTIPAGEAILLTFAAPEEGRYIFSWPIDVPFGSMEFGCWGADGEGLGSYSYQAPKYNGYGWDMTAQTYTIRLENTLDETWTFDAKIQASTTDVELMFYHTPSAVVYVGNSYSLSIIPTQINGVLGEVTWSNSNPDVASIEAYGEYAEVFFEGEGVTTITATNSTNGASVSHTFYVYPEDAGPTMSFFGNGGSFIVTTQWDSWETDGYGILVPPGMSMRDMGESISDPVSEYGTFAGWVPHIFVEGEGYIPVEGAEMLTTEEALDYPAVEDYEITLMAQWPDWDDGSGGEGGSDYQETNVYIDANFGSYILTDPNGEMYEVQGRGLNVPIGSTIAEVGYNVSDMIYWTERSFDHWSLGVEYPEYNENGEIVDWHWENWDENLTTEKMLNYPIQEEGFSYYFTAQWEGNDKDYMAWIDFDGCGAEIVVENPYFDEPWYNWNYTIPAKKDGTKIGEQTDEIIANVIGEEAWGDFEGWLACDQLNWNYILRSDTVYTYEQILDMVPDANVTYVPKWSNVDLSDYEDVFGILPPFIPEGVEVADMSVGVKYDLTAAQDGFFTFTAAETGSYTLSTDAPMGIDSELYVQILNWGELHIFDGYGFSQWLEEGETLTMKAQPLVDCKIWMEKTASIDKIELLSQNEATYLLSEYLDATAILEDTQVKLTFSDGTTKEVNGGELWRYEQGYNNLPTEVSLEDVTQDGATLVLEVTGAVLKVPFVFDKATVVDMEVIPAEDLPEFYEGVSGFVSEYGVDGPFFYYTAADYAFSLSTYRFTWSDGRVEDYVMDLEKGAYYHGVELWMNCPQYEDPWSVGENTFAVGFGELSDTLTVEILPNNVESVEVLSMSPTQYTLGDPEHFVKTEDGWQLAIALFDEYQVKLNYKDGTSEILTEADESDLRGVVWLLDGKEVEAYWDPETFTGPGKQTVYFKFMGQEVPIELDIVDHIVEPGNTFVSEETVEDALQDIQNGSVTLDVTAPDDSEEDVFAVKIPVASVESMMEQAVEQVVVELDSATVTMDAAALAAVAGQASGVGFTLSVENIQEETLTREQQTALEGKKVDLVLNAQILSAGEPISDFKGGSVTVAVPFKVPAGADAKDYSIWYVAEDGSMEPMETRYEDGKLIFTTKHFSDYVVIKNTEQGDDEVMKGDLDNNGSVDDEDVIYLLWHTLMPKDYEVNQDVDYDANGIVDDEDVIYLLWHTLMPKDYPL